MNDIFKLIDTFGTIPFAGTVVGMGRISVGAALGSVGLVVEIAAEVFHLKDTAKNAEKFVDRCFSQIHVGLMELIPVVGTIYHISKGWTGIFGNCSGTSLNKRFSLI